MKSKKIIIRPVITEKSLNLVETENQYTFVVNNGTNKLEISKAVQGKFDVEVLSVRIINTLGKRVSFGRKRIGGMQSNTKKAIVTLKKGDTISDFSLK